MAKTFVSDQIMAPDKMKPILAISKREPVQASIALTTDGEALLLLDKKAKPRAVMGMLRAHAAKAKVGLNGSSVRFGRAEVDPDNDPGTVRLFVNKETPGVMRVKLTELIKRVPYQKVELEVDPSLENEPEHEDVELAGPEPGGQPHEAPGGQPHGAPDLAASREVLAALVERIPGVAGADAARLATLKKIAALAGAKSQANDAAGTMTAIAALRQAIDAAAPAPARDPADGAAVRLAKGLLLWNGTRSFVKQELTKLEAAIVAQSIGEADADAIRDNVGSLSDAVLDALDDRLTDRLNALRGTADPAEKRAISGEAREIVAGYQRFVAESELMNDLDDNGVLPLAIRPRLTTVLDAVLQVV
jgi:hypothetical protein